MNYLFELPDTSGNLFKAEEHLPLIVYFYPKDNTPGCTQEAREFSLLADDFKQAGFTIAGISRDSIASHQKFCDKHNLTIHLLSDADETVCRRFDVIGEKNMYGKKVFGIIRSTFVLHNNGDLLHQWRKVKAAGHAREVLDFVRTLH